MNISIRSQVVEFGIQTSKNNQDVGKLVVECNFACFMYCLM